jgi:hypothetical protein
MILRGIMAVLAGLILALIGASIVMCAYVIVYA